MTLQDIDRKVDRGTNIFEFGLKRLAKPPACPAGNGAVHWAIMNVYSRPKAVIELVSHMKTQHLALASLTAVLVQPIVGLLTFFPFWRGVFPPLEVLVFYSLAVLISASLVLLLLGIPCFGALEAKGKLNFLGLSLCGISVGMLPYLLIAYPRHIKGYTAVAQWHGYSRAYYENGKPATVAWLNYAETALGFGVHGLVGSLVFYVFWCRYRTQQR